RRARRPPCPSLSAEESSGPGRSRAARQPGRLAACRWRVSRLPREFGAGGMSGRGRCVPRLIPSVVQRGCSAEPVVGVGETGGGGSGCAVYREAAGLRGVCQAGPVVGANAGVFGGSGGGTVHARGWVLVHRDEAMIRRFGALLG